MNLIIFLIILVLLVLVHEFGHFIVAKKSGIRVDEFGLGLPPKLFGKKFGETLYSINTLPFGGFVKIFGENPDDETNPEGKDLSRSMAHKGKWVQASVLAAGITFNLIFAWLIISSGLMFGLPTSVDTPNMAGVTDVKLVISGVMPKSPAETAGLKPGDILLSLKTEKSSLAENLNLETVKNFIANSENQIDISFKRGSAVSDIKVLAGNGIISDSKAIGISMEMIGIIKLPFFKAFTDGAVMTARLVKNVATGIFYFFRDAILGHLDLTQVAGPVGMVTLVGDARDLGIPYLIFFTALISINLAVINLIPFPALDGGRLLVLLIEAIKGSPLKPKLVNTVNLIGFSFLIILMLAVTYHDILKLF